MGPLFLWQCLTKRDSPPPQEGMGSNLPSKSESISMCSPRDDHWFDWDLCSLCSAQSSQGKIITKGAAPKTEIFTSLPPYVDMFYFDLNVEFFKKCQKSWFCHLFLRSKTDWKINDEYLTVLTTSGFECAGPCHNRHNNQESLAPR